ncbi:MAG TPA: ArsC family reductase [Steroidobacteraceae bacterium]|nr:ArsC family reductase [Steroidobacteraceae bacterium]
MTAPDEIKMFGIKNCDTIKKARAWLDSHKIEYAFHDYKGSGVDRETLQRWCKELGWEKVLNRAGTTFKKLPDADCENLNEQKAIRLMLAQPSMIKRPMVEIAGKKGAAKLVLGFKPDDYSAAFK